MVLTLALLLSAEPILLEAPSPVMFHHTLMIMMTFLEELTILNLVTKTKEIINMMYSCF